MSEQINLRRKKKIMGGGRSEIEKEKTKMRERQRRAITTNIFDGLRRHGGYHLSPRADINQVLRHLAMEAGWVVLPDGTTFRSSNSISISKTDKCCPACGAIKTTTTTTPSSNVVIGGEEAEGEGGECSTTASPDGHIQDPVAAVEDLILIVDSFCCDNRTPLAPYIYGVNGSTGGGEVGVSPFSLRYQLQQQLYTQEAKPSSHCTPLGSPLRHPS